MSHFITEYYRDGHKPEPNDIYAEFYVCIRDCDDSNVEKLTKILYEPFFTELWKEYWIISENYDILNIRFFFPVENYIWDSQ